MKPINFEQTLSLMDYERLRPVLRPMLIHEKARRRLGVGTHLTFLFENAQTVWYQVQEMIRTEKMTARDAIQHEVDTYNELIPRRGEIAATMLIEYADPRERDAALRRLVGLERHLWLVVGGQRFAASFDDRQMSMERISAVQFVRFAMPGISVDQFLDYSGKGQVAVEADHPSLAARGAIDGVLASALCEDLRKE
ncbi:MAG: hypothetical protein JWM69_1228 [Candidatus Binatus sp.]|nr:hypothetical protein [Candidatus Binatus sp.]